MNEIKNLFKLENNIFTVFVIEQRFAVGRGHEYLKSYFNTPSYVNSDNELKNRFVRIMETIEKSVPPVSNLISLFSSGISLVSISETITSLCKLFTVHEHQAAGPDIIDPIILQEGKITKRALTQLINLHKDSIVQPTIILVLMDNDFERAKTLLAECPDGINIKMIRNNGKTETYKVINCGAENINSFINSFAEQCYSTCSKTTRSILRNSEWSNNEIISAYAPQLFKIRTNLLFDQKDIIRKELSDLITSIPFYSARNTNDAMLLQSIECTAKLFRVFCNDYGGQDIMDVEKLANHLGNEVLLAHVYRYAEFFPKYSNAEKEDLYKKGCDIFKRNKMEDHAIYCKNNMLTQQFYSGMVFADSFRELQEEAINSVPGMVGLSHIYNNTGIAYLYCGHPEVAIDFFNKGLDYAKYQSRIVQNLALESNKLIAERYSFATIDENRIRFLVRRIIDGMGLTQFPFLSADYILNVLAVAYSQSTTLGFELLQTFPIKELVNNSFKYNLMGSGQRFLHMQYLSSHYKESFPLIEQCNIPKNMIPPRGKRMEFVTQYGYSPFDFDTWL